tara:strand:- start:103 stop:453 length:351 start_codon:yes stop_codon:yes gene_type:complete
MFDKILDELIAEDKLGETWRLEMAPVHARYSFSSSKSGNENWAKNTANKLTQKEKENFKFIGIFSEGESTEGPIVDGYVFHCTQDYLDKAPHMHRDKRKACKRHLKTGKVEEYLED